MQHKVTVFVITLLLDHTLGTIENFLFKEHILKELFGIFLKCLFSKTLEVKAGLKFLVCASVEKNDRKKTGKTKKNGEIKMGRDCSFRETARSSKDRKEKRETKTDSLVGVSKPKRKLVRRLFCLNRKKK